MGAAARPGRGARRLAKTLAQCLVAAAATLPSTAPRLPAAAAASPHAGRKVSAILNPTPLHPTAGSFHKIPSRIVQDIWSGMAQPEVLCARPRRWRGSFTWLSPLRCPADTQMVMRAAPNMRPRHWRPSRRIKHKKCSFRPPAELWRREDVTLAGESARDGLSS